MPAGPADDRSATTPAQDRGLVIFFSCWIGVPILGNLVLLVTGHADKLGTGFFMVAIGALGLLSYAIYRRGRRRSSR